MFSSGIVSIIFGFTAVGDWLFTHNNELGVEVLGIFPSYAKFPMVVLITTIIWLSVTFLTKPEKSNTLYEFYKKIQPGGPGWKKTIQEAKAENIEIENTNQPWSVPSGIIAMILAMIAIYSAMFATGYWIYGSYVWAVILTISGIISGILLSRIWKKIKAKVF